MFLHNDTNRENIDADNWQVKVYNYTNKLYLLNSLRIPSTRMSPKRINTTKRILDFSTFIAAKQYFSQWRCLIANWTLTVAITRPLNAHAR